LIAGHIENLPLSRRETRAGKLLDWKICSHDAPVVNATISNRGQMVLPMKARKAARIRQGDVVEVRPEGDGRIVLVRLERPKELEPIRVKFTRRKGRHTVGSTGRPITSEEVRNLLNELV
jgi:AbrB family looped-hinge helix DNA binding protein